MFRCLGYPKPILDNPSKSRARATVRMQLRAFKSTVRGVVQRGFYESEQKQLFRPIKVTHEKFLHLGVKGKQPAFNCSIIYKEGVKDVIEHSIITLGHRISSKQLGKFRSGESQLTPNMPNLNGRVGWDSSLKVIQQPLPICGNASNMSNSNNKRPFSIAIFQCPHCKAPETSANQAFQLEDLDKLCKCKACKKSLKVRDWSCSCLKAWHLCDLHQSCANTTSKASAPCGWPIPGTKRAIGPLSNEQLHQFDTKRIKRSPPSILPPAPNILSVKLRERFSYLFK